MPEYRGAFINLDRSTQRRDQMQAQLRKFEFAPAYERFPAIDGSTLAHQPHGRIAAGELGAFYSHTEVLTDAARRSMPVHVLEDDAILSPHTCAVLDEVVAAGLLDRFDLLLTDTFVLPDLGMLKALSAAFDTARSGPAGQMGLNSLQVMDVSGQNFACLTSYIMGPKGFGGVLPLLRIELQKGPSLPIDLFLRQCATSGVIRVGLLAPFVTSIDLAEVHRSTIAAANPAANASVMVLAVLRYLFFVDRDLDIAKDYLDRSVAGADSGKTEEKRMILQVLEFVLSDRFRQF